MSVETSVAPSRLEARVRAIDARFFVPLSAGILLLVPSVVWAFLDRGIWPWDPSWYGETSVDLWAALQNNVGAWGTAMTKAFGTKPPAIAWFGEFFVPLGSMVGGDSSALLLSIVVCEIGVVALVFAACRKLRLSYCAAGVGTLVVAGSPLFVVLGHSYFAEPIQTLAIAWGLYVMASAARWPIALTAVQIPGVVAFAMLAKLSSPVYIALPLAAAVLLAIRGAAGRARRTRWWGRDWRVITSTVLSVALVEGAVGWYDVNLHTAIAFARLSSANTGLYGFDQGFAKELPMWMRNFRHVAFLPRVDVAIAVLLLAAIALLVRRRGVRPTLDPRFVASIACAGTIALVVALFATQANQETRYLLGLIPCLGIFVAVVVEESRSRLLAVAALAVLAVEFGLVQVQSFGHTLIGSMSFATLAAPAPQTSFARELNTITAQTCNKTSAGKINMVGADYPWFNHNTLEMLAAERYLQSGLTCYYTALGYAEQNPNVAWARVQQFDSPYYISIDYGDPSNPLPESERSLVIPSDAFNAINTNVFRRVRASHVWIPVPGSRHDGLFVLRNAGS